ncbi:MAG: hypothetical protein LBQ58_08270 [Synergistaceae bacterium]|nr:hypothetical protein [Synergistaceae bacterium]
MAAEPPGFDVSLTEYVAKMAIALVFFIVAGYALARYLPGRFGMKAGRKLQLIAALALGRDMIYIVRTGPTVVALFVGKSSSTVIGSWSSEEWDDYEEAVDVATQQTDGV